MMHYLHKINLFHSILLFYYRSRMKRRHDMYLQFCNKLLAILEPYYFRTSQISNSLKVLVTYLLIIYFKVHKTKQLPDYFCLDTNWCEELVVIITNILITIDRYYFYLFGSYLDMINELSVALLPHLLTFSLSWNVLASFVKGCPGN